MIALTSRILELCVVCRHRTELHNFNIGLLSQFNFKIYLIVIGQLDMRGALKTADCKYTFIISMQGDFFG